MRTLNAIVIAGLGWLAASAAQAQTQAQRSTCPPLLGVGALWAKPQTRFIIFGEVHGTAEGPALFADTVCHASTVRPVIVALEAQSDFQPAFDAYLASDGSPQARAAFLNSEAWPGGVDGRGSEAILAMIERVRRMRAEGRPVRLVGFIPSGRTQAFRQHYQELGMAAALAQAAYTDPNALVIALVGRIHSSKAPFTGEFSLIPAAMHLPADETIALEPALTGGRAWNCRKSGCGDNPFPGTDKSPRGVVLHSALESGHDGTYSPGKPYTASPPVKAARAR